MLRALALAAALAAPAAAQQAAPPDAPPPRFAVVVLDRDALYARSAFGRRVRDEVAAASDALAAENARIEAELVAEEQDLTERRAEMEPAAFRALADAFDARVERIRQEQDGKGLAIAQRAERAQATFLARANPLLVALAREVGALVILDRRGVIASADQVDVTDLAVRRVDAALGDGAALEPAPTRRPGAGAVSPPGDAAP